MLTLWEHPLSPYAQKVKIALYEKGIPFTAKTPNLFGGTEPEFLESSPRREVPTLIDGDFKIFDSTVILEYIEDRWPDPPLLPASPADRARVRMLEDQCDTYVEAINWGLAEIRSSAARPESSPSGSRRGRASSSPASIAGSSASSARARGSTGRASGGAILWCGPTLRPPRRPVSRRRRARA
jgi:glutathione S-transferase/RNA polymerase-associated protein